MHCYSFNCLVGEIKRIRLEYIFFAALLIFALFFPERSAKAYGNDHLKESLNEAVKTGDLVGAVKSIQPFADEGDSKAQWHLCLLIWHADDAAHSLEMAMRWCEAAKEEQSNASDWHAVFSEIIKIEGIEPSKPKREIIKYLESIAREGNVDAQWVLHNLYDEKMSVFGKEDKEAQKREREARDRWYQEALSNDHPIAIYSEANKIDWWRSEVTDHDRTQYVDLMTKSAELGFPAAMNRLGDYYAPVGYGEQAAFKDYVAATRWYLKAVEVDEENGDYDSLYKILRNTENPLQDFDLGLEYLIKASQYWRVDAKLTLAKIYLEGDELIRNTGKARELYENVISQKYVSVEDFVEAHYWLALIYWIPNRDEAQHHLPHFESLLTHKHIDSIRILAGPYYEKLVRSARYHVAKHMENDSGQPPDFEKIKQLYSLSAEAGDDRAKRWIDFNEAKNKLPNSGMIRDAQSKLSKIGISVGAVDGVFGRQTFDAVRAFQCISNGSVDGQVTEKLLVSLEEASQLSLLSKKEKNEKLFAGISDLNQDCVRGAIAIGADPNAIKYSGGPLDSNHGYSDRDTSDDEGIQIRYQITEILLDAGSRISANNSNAFSAISSGDIPLLKLLLENGEKLTKKVDGRELRHWAAHYLQEGVLEYYKSIGVKTLEDRQLWQEVLTNWPVRANGLKRGKELLDRGASPNYSDSASVTPLVSAIENGFVSPDAHKVISLLLARGADPNKRSKIYFRNDGREYSADTTPLIHLVRNTAYASKINDKRPILSERRIESVKRAFALMLDAGAKVAAPDDFNRTPLHYAAIDDNILAARLLLSRHAPKDRTDRNGKTPLDYAESSEIIALLKGRVIAENKKRKESLGSSGSGVLLGQNGVLVTNAHVISNCSSLEAVSSQGTEVAAEIITADKQNDLALLQLKKGGFEGGENISPRSDVTIGIRPGDVRLGEAVVVAGYPYGESLSSGLKVTAGIVSGITGLGNNIAQFQLDAAVQPGNSGGPVFDHTGNVIGLVVAQLNKVQVAQATGSLPENTNFAIKSSLLRTFLAVNSVEIPEPSNNKKFLNTEAISNRAKTVTYQIRCAR